MVRGSLDAGTGHGVGCSRWHGPHLRRAVRLRKRGGSSQGGGLNSPRASCAAVVVFTATTAAVTGDAAPRSGAVEGNVPTERRWARAACDHRVARAPVPALLLPPVWPWLRRKLVKSSELAGSRSSAKPETPEAGFINAGHGAVSSTRGGPAVTGANGAGAVAAAVAPVGVAVAAPSPPKLNDTTELIGERSTVPPEVITDAQQAMDSARRHSPAGVTADPESTAIMVQQPTFLRKPAWQRDFWRWSAGVGWTMDILLIAWAIFLRRSGLVEEQPGPQDAATASSSSRLTSVPAGVSSSSGSGSGSSSGSSTGISSSTGTQKSTPFAAAAKPAPFDGNEKLKSLPRLNEATYESSLRRFLGEEQSLTVSDGVLGGLLRDEKANLDLLREGVKAVRFPLPAADVLPTSDASSVVEEEEYEDLLLVMLIDELQAKVTKDREFLRQRDAKLLDELQEQPRILFKLSERVMEKRLIEIEQQEIRREPQFSDEMSAFASAALIPFSLFLTLTLVGTALSSQMLNVATAWREQRISDGDKRRRRWGNRIRLAANKMSRLSDDLSRGDVDKFQQGCTELASVASKWAKGPTWEELVRAELAEFWDRWGYKAWGLKLRVPSGVPANPAAFAEQWQASAESVIKQWQTLAVSDAKVYVEAKLAAWAKDGVKPEQAESTVARASAEGGGIVRRPVRTGLVIRIFGGWGSRNGDQEDWANIANIPLAGGWREKALRLLVPEEEEKRDVPILGDICEMALTALVAGQVSRVVSESVWGSLTTDLWKRSGSSSSTDRSGPPFHIGYEVVELAGDDEEEMLAVARAMPAEGERVVRVPQIEAQIREQNAPLVSDSGK